MTKILVECPGLIASVRVGVLQPLEPLQASGCCEIRYRNTMDLKKEDIAWCDVLITVRGSEFPTLMAVRAAKKAGKFLIYFLDDDLLGIPQGYASTAYYSDARIQGYIVEILSLCDVLWAVNKRILDKYGKWCSRTVLSKVPAHIQADIQNKDDNKLHVLYAGSMDHTKMIQEKIAPAVRRILEEYSERIDFTFIGANPQIHSHAGVKHYAYFDSYEDYQKMLQEGGFHLGVAPGFRTSFFECKYYNKFIEYSCRGIVGIYENCPPFTDIVQDGENGLLCDGHWNDWYAVFQDLIKGKYNLRQLATNAQQLLLRDFSPQKIANELAEQIPELVKYVSAEVDIRKIQIPPMKLVFLYEHIHFNWRTYGLLSVFVIPGKAVRKVWRFIRQKVSV